MVLDFRFGHWKCPNREGGKGQFRVKVRKKGLKQWNPSYAILYVNTISKQLSDQIFVQKWPRNKRLSFLERLDWPNCRQKKHDWTWRVQVSITKNCTQDLNLLNRESRKFNYQCMTNTTDVKAWVPAPRHWTRGWQRSRRGDAKSGAVRIADCRQKTNITHNH